MKPFAAILCFAMLAVVAAQPPGYKYQAPGPVHLPSAQQPIRQNIPTGNFRPQQSNSGIYSSVLSPPLVQFNAQGESQNGFSAQTGSQLLSTPIQNIAGPVSAPGPISVPQQQNFVQAQQQQHQQQQSFVVAQQPIQQNLAIPSIPQNHQQQIVQQQLGGFQQPLQSGFQQNFPSYQQPQTIITKDIYIHSAPEDREESSLGQQLDNVPIRKNYRIVFIKAPSQNLRLASAALKRAQSANEEKTVIYVLSKKPDLSEVHHQLQQAQGEQKASKPEVYFIKYKTQEEAQRAQQEIQAQYDSLGGSTHISDEGIAPIASVIGSSSGSLNLSGPISGGGGSSFLQQNYQSQAIGSSSLSLGSAPTQKYLPAQK